MVKKQEKIKTRPKGSKNRLPFITFPQSIDFAKKIWEQAHDSDMSFRDISEYMGVHPQKAVRVLSILEKSYGIIEKTEHGFYRLTTNGKLIAQNNFIALKETFSKDSMFNELLNNFLGKNVTDGALLEYIRKNYKYVDSEEIKQRLIDGMKIIQSVSGGIPTQKTDASVSALALFQLKYALNPPTEKEMEFLVTGAAISLKDSGDDVLKLIADLMLEKKKDKKELASLLDRAMKKLNLIKEDNVQEEETAEASQ
jgi:hypothetical protein